MEISNKIPPVSPQNNVVKTEETAVKAARPAVTGDRVAISDQAKELQAALQAVKQMDDADHEKVARIKAQIKAGNYKVDAEKAAGKMIDESF